MTDEELVLRAREGDAEAFDQLVVRHQAAVYRVALSALRHPQDAEDAGQDAFVRAWTSLKRFRGDATFRTWLLTIAWNRALARRRGVANWFRRRAPLEQAFVVAAGSRRHDETLEDRRMANEITRVIGTLTPKLRDTFLLAHGGELTYDEISAVQHVPLGTIKWRVAEARRKIRERLAQAGYDGGR